jgi:hypothetical protein
MQPLSTFGGGYAREFADLVRIHTTTAAVTLACARRRSS